MRNKSSFPCKFLPFCKLGKWSNCMTEKWCFKTCSWCLQLYASWVRFPAALIIDGYKRNAFEHGRGWGTEVFTIRHARKNWVCFTIWMERLLEVPVWIKQPSPIYVFLTLSSFSEWLPCWKRLLRAPYFHSCNPLCRQCPLRQCSTAAFPGVFTRFICVAP